MATTAFYYMATASIVSAILAVTRKNPVHSMLWVLALFLHVAGIFLVLHAEFLAAVQVIVYAGAVVILFLFVIMLLGVDRAEDLDVEPIVGQRPVAAVVGTARLPAGQAVFITRAEGDSGLQASSSTP